MMKKIYILLVVVLIIIGISFFLMKPKTVSAVQAIVPAGISAVEAKHIVTNLNWNIALSGWSRWLDVSDCTEIECSIKIIFSSEQICPESAADDEWCDETQLSGKIQFIAHGFNFVEDKKSDSVFCALKSTDVADSWKIEGVNCPSDFKELQGYKK